MDTEIEIPRDSDGYFRRQCPQCERELKWAEAEEIANTLYCPYCGTPAGADQWWTAEQVDAIHAIMQRESARIVANAIGDSFRRLNDTGVVRASLDIPHMNPPPPLFEPDDMAAIASPCHPNKPTKVLESWTDPLHCIICGAQFII